MPLYPNRPLRQDAMSVSSQFNERNVVSTLQLHWQPRTLCPERDLRADVLRNLPRQLDSPLPMQVASHRVHLNSE